MGHRGEFTGGNDLERTVDLSLLNDRSRSTDFEVVSDAPASFGDYEIISELGSGGMGRVFKAKQKSLGREVALKTLRSRDFSDSGLVQRLYQEAEAAAQLDHPGIVPVYAFGAEDGAFFFTMALIDGHGLDERLRRGPLDNRTAAVVVQQVAEAVAYAHRKGVVHRDLKPANILLDRNGAVKITDFGIARRLNINDLDEVEPAVQARYPEAIGTALRLTQAGTILGTPGFMAPEQSTTNGRIGPGVDIWALGAILYACLTGRPPFVGATALETLALTVDTDPVPPNEINPEADPELVEICLRCLSKEIHDRYASADEVAAELARWREGKSVRSKWAVWRTKIAKQIDGMPDLIPLVAGLIVHRIGNIQAGIFVGCVLAGIALCKRRKDLSLLIVPAITGLLVLLSFPAVRVFAASTGWRAGLLPSAMGLIAAVATLACGLTAIDVPKSFRWSARTAAVIGFAMTFVAIAAAAMTTILAESGFSASAATGDIEKHIHLLAGWAIAVPAGFAFGALLGQANGRLDRFGPEGLPAFLLGAALLAVAASLAFRELRPDIAPASSRFAIFGPGPALSVAEHRAGYWMSNNKSIAPADMRQAASLGIFWFKLLMIACSMALGGAATSVMARLLAGAKR